MTIWFHGSPYELTELQIGSTITPDPMLARVFSHKPSLVSDARAEGRALKHNGRLPGWLYVVDEPVGPEDIVLVPGSTIGPDKERRTTRVLRVRKIERTELAAEGLLSGDEEHALLRC